MSKTFKTVNGLGAYGPRIFVAPCNTDALTYLASRCKWGGSDKQWGGMLGFEFEQQEFLEAVDWLLAAGYAQSEWEGCN